MSTRRDSRANVWSGSPRAASLGLYTTALKISREIIRQVWSLSLGWAENGTTYVSGPKRRVTDSSDPGSDESPNRTAPPGPARG